VTVTRDSSSTFEEEKDEEEKDEIEEEEKEKCSFSASWTS
jgi:hypothetical protein